MMSNVHIPMVGVAAFGVFFILGYFLYATMYAALGAMVNSDQEAQQVQWPAMLPIIFAIVLSTPVLQHPSSQLAFWTSMVPFFAPILMFVRVMVESGMRAMPKSATLKPLLENKMLSGFTSR